MRRGKAPRSSSLTILLTSDTKSQLLNRDFRGKNRPTNVLSFPASPTGGAYLGDIALAYGVTSAEARAGDKRLAAHAMHLTVHGVLHLLGFGHETKRAAHIMEPLEVKILAELGIGNPYAQEAA